MFRQLPLIVGIVAIVSLTVVQSLMSDRFIDTNVTAEQRGQLLKDVPMQFGEWEGKDLAVTEEVRDTAGAVGCVSRLYVNMRTNEAARLWIIVGHARDISAHTPDICYKGSGFSTRSPENSLFSFSDSANFWTNTFVKEDSYSGRNLERVFWAWHNPKRDQPVTWEAKENPRYTYGNARAIFKMYFASPMRDLNETTDDSSASKFGKEFLPIINGILAKWDTPQPAGNAAATGAAEPAAEKPAE